MTSPSTVFRVCNHIHPHTPTGSRHGRLANGKTFSLCHCFHLLVISTWLQATMSPISRCDRESKNQRQPARRHEYLQSSRWPSLPHNLRSPALSHPSSIIKSFLSAFDGVNLHPNMIAPENGRQLLLDQLPRISSNDSLLTTIIHDLFEKNDRIDESHYGLKTTAKFESLAKDSNLEVSKFESWCGSSMKFLDNVNYDLKRLEEYSVEWWNISILKEALKLGTTLLKLSKMLVDTFDNISVKKFKNSAPCIINQDSTTEELVSSVKGSLSCLQATWANFLTNVVSKAFPNEPEGEATRLVESLCSNAPISAATLRELLIQNTIYCKRRQFLEFLAGFATEQEKLKAGAHFLSKFREVSFAVSI